MLQTLIQTLPDDSEVVSLSTGGQADRWDVFEKLKGNFTWDGVDPFQAEPLYTILKAIILDKSDFDFLKEMELLPPQLQSIVVQLLVETKKDPKMFKMFLDKGYIHEKNWQLIKNLPEKYRGDIYDLLLREDKIKEKDITDILAAGASLCWVSLMEKYVDCRHDLKPDLIQSIYKWLKPLFGFSEYHSQLISILGRKEFLPLVDVIEFCKKFESREFSSIKFFIEKALQNSSNRVKLFTDIIPLMFEKGFSEGLEWLISYNAEHKLFDKSQLHELINAGCISLFINVSFLSQEQQEAIIQLILKVREFVSLDERALASLCLKRNDMQFIFKNIITESVVKSHPEIRGLVLRRLTIHGCQNDVEFFELMEKLFIFTDQEKGELVNTLLPEAALTKDKLFIHRLSSWLSLMNENEKQEVLRNAFNKGVNEEIIQMLISLGLDVECKTFVTMLNYKLQSMTYRPLPFQFYLDHMKVALNQISNDQLKEIIYSWNFSIQLSKELLHYAFIERKISGISELLRPGLSQIYCYLNLADCFFTAEEKSVGNHEWVIEWCIKQGADLKDIITPERIRHWYSNNLVLLVADGCSLDLIRQILQLRAQSESKEIYDRVLLVSAMKGRVDILGYLLERGCKYSSDTIQLALFYAADRGFW